DPSSERTIVDPNKIDPKGATTIDFVVPSLDGRRVAVSMSENGSEDGTIYFYDVTTGVPLADRIPRVQYPTAGGSVAWNADGTGVYYTRYPHAGERPANDLNFYQQVYFHRLGSAVDQDHYELGKDFPRIAEIELETKKDGRYVLASVANGDGGDFAHYLRGPDGLWKQITKFSDQIKEAKFGEDNSLYLVSRDHAPHGKILRLLLPGAELALAVTVAPAGEPVIKDICAVTNGFYVNDMVGGPSQIRYFSVVGGPSLVVPLKAISAVPQMLEGQDNRLLFRNTTFIDPPIWMIFDPATGQSRPTALAETSPADFSNVEVTREFAPAKDGTRIPLNIIRNKDIKLDGSNPTLLYGYGGYGVSLSPVFKVSRSIWLEHGGVYVVANLRGGGEFGEEWHKDGNLTHKQNVFDDFAACAQYLIDTRYTSPAKLAVEGASNGGLLMGAFLTQHPGLVRAVVSHVGIYDSLRSELTPNGAFNVTEFGTVKDPADFRALYAYSPYHHVVDGVRYPGVLLMTGDHDGRVDPFHSRKMAARLQAADPNGYPILLRTTAAAGHGMGTSLAERIAEEADAWAFLFDQLGIDYTGTARP
ncbi:MAG TPA: prolyl oligopeptidase family serine peptidase, partial [Candidatus Saccharimonadales bacterium]|nr:prolyl oligopeptidase family serine peptidase [Candidatus Saccharimonadales bacterium]